MLFTLNTRFSATPAIRLPFLSIVKLVVCEVPAESTIITVSPIEGAAGNVIVSPAAGVTRSLSPLTAEYDSVMFTQLFGILPETNEDKPVTVEDRADICPPAVLT